MNKYFLARLFFCATIFLQPTHHTDAALNKKKPNRQELKARIDQLPTELKNIIKDYVCDNRQHPEDCKKAIRDQICGIVSTDLIKKTADTTVVATQDSIEITTEIGLFTLQPFKNELGDFDYHLFLKKPHEEEKSEIKLALVQILSSTIEDAQKPRQSFWNQVDSLAYQFNTIIEEWEKNPIKNSFLVKSKNGRFVALVLLEVPFDRNGNDFRQVFTVIDLQNKKGNYFDLMTPKNAQLSLANNGVYFTSTKYAQDCNNSKFIYAFNLHPSPAWHDGTNNKFPMELFVKGHTSIKKVLGHQQDFFDNAFFSEEKTNENMQQ